MSWTDDRVQKLIQLWDQGLSASQIAGKLGGVSRSAVIGKLHRMGKNRKSPEAPKRLSAASSERVRRAKADSPSGGCRPSRKRACKPASRSKPALKSACVYPIQMNPAPILELKPGQCRFALNGHDDTTDADTLFCGGPTRPGSSYCEHHHALVWRPYKRARKRARAHRPKQTDHAQFIYGVAA